MNPRPLDCQSSVLPTELQPHSRFDYITETRSLRQVGITGSIFSIFAGPYLRFEARTDERLRSHERLPSTSELLSVLTDFADVVGHHTGHGDIGQGGDHPGHGFIAFIEVFKHEVVESGNTELDSGEESGVIDKGLHEGVSLAESGAFQGSPGGEVVGDIEGGQRDK